MILGCRKTACKIILKDELKRDRDRTLKRCQAKSLVQQKDAKFLSVFYKRLIYHCFLSKHLISCICRMGSCFLSHKRLEHRANDKSVSVASSQMIIRKMDFNKSLKTSHTLKCKYKLIQVNREQNQIQCFS